MIGKIFNDQTNRYENHDKQVIEYYELGTLLGAPTLKLWYDDGSFHFVNLSNGVVTAGDDLAFVSTHQSLGESVPDPTTIRTMVITANGTTQFSADGGADGSFVIAGTFGSGTVRLNYYVDSTAIAYDSGSLTANGGFSLRWASDLNSVSLTGATNPSLTAVAYF